MTQARTPEPEAPARRRLRPRTKWLTVIVIVLMLGWIGYLVVGIATNDTIRSATSVPQLASMVQQNLRAHNGKELQTHFAANTISMDYGSTFVDKLEDNGYSDIQVRPGAGFIEVTASGADGTKLCTAWDADQSEDGTYLLDPTPSVNPTACRG
ncbi:hypothetical protein [Sciscionella sediminilitoris]|uniref:hypothetical protein n=1 Tax=Sciscionella sediminilitoris TaxID=1445613 RepID=UPI0004DF0E92|nr:hypothetical protein [Sciscionella sp. SE31]